MAARHTLWRWAGIADDWWGRIKMLALAFGVVTTALFALWALAIRDLGVAGIIVLALAAIFGLLTILLAIEIWRPESRTDERSRQDQDDPSGALAIEAEDSQRWGGRPGYVQHVLVTNTGPVGRFKASVTSDISGLDKTYGRAMRLVWEQPYDGEITLGKSEQGRLRLGEFRREDDGRLVVWFFAVPTRRHPAADTSYLKTQPYEVPADAMSFQLCVRNIEKDIPYVRHARMTFATDGKPSLELFEDAATSESGGVDGDRRALADFLADEQKVGHEIRMKAVSPNKHGGLTAVCDEFTEWGRGVDERVRVEAPEFFAELLRTSAPWPYQRKQEILLNMDHRLGAYRTVENALRGDANNAGDTTA